MTKTMELSGLDELMSAFENAPDVAIPIASKAMEQGLLLIEGAVKEYPPQPDRARTKSFNTYIRGKGRYPKSYFSGGSFDPRGGQGRAKLVSERLGTKWTHTVNIDDSAVTGIVGNTASYADVIQGKEEDQNYWHGVTGWPRLDDTIDQMEEQIMDVFGAAVDELLKE